MKICYVDESGLAGDEPVLVMAGIISDMQELPKTLRDWQPRLNGLLRRHRPTDWRLGSAHDPVAVDGRTDAPAT